MAMSGGDVGIDKDPIELQSPPMCQSPPMLNANVERRGRVLMNMDESNVNVECHGMGRLGQTFFSFFSFDGRGRGGGHGHSIP